jgi:hypothetical protein
MLLEQFKSIHENTYDYSKVVYKGLGLSVKIICKKHGVFEQIVRSHIKGKGCSKCKGGVKLTQEEVIRFLKQNYSEDYDLSQLKYINSKTRMTVIEPKYKTKHLMTWGSLKIGTKCSLVNSENKTEYIKILFVEKHDLLYDYNLVKYKNEATKVKILCKKHGEFLQVCKSHLSGSGGPKCHGKGFSKNEIIEELGSKEFIKYLSKCTGLKNIFLDKGLEGGGLQQSLSGGSLNMHTDFTSHITKKNWKRNKK